MSKVAWPRRKVGSDGSHMALTKAVIQSPYARAARAGALRGYQLNHPKETNVQKARQHRERDPEIPFVFLTAR
jgi:hypothetical protein